MMESEENIQKFVPPCFEKSQEDIKALTDFFKTQFLTNSLDEAQHLVLAKAMYKKNISNSQIIVRYGDLGDEYFVLARGKIKVTVYLDGTNPNDEALESKISFEKNLESDFKNDLTKPLIGFGEIALLYNDKRTASVTAISDCELWVLSGDVFKQVIA